MITNRFPTDNDLQLEPHERKTVRNGGRFGMGTATRKRKIQSGVWLAPAFRMLMLNIGQAKGWTNGQTVQEALAEYAYNHRDELKFLGNLLGEKNGHF